MAQNFDPYFKWLGIPPEEQPPNHYRLLGVPPFVDDLDVIENAADQRMAHVRNFQAGQKSQQAQSLLNELSAARIALLNPESKLAYDKKLKEESPSPEPPSMQSAGTPSNKKPLNKQSPGKQVPMAPQAESASLADLGKLDFGFGPEPALANSGSGGQYPSPSPTKQRSGGLSPVVLLAVVVGLGGLLLVLGVVGVVAFTQSNAPIALPGGVPSTLEPSAPIENLEPASPTNPSPVIRFPALVETPASEPSSPFAVRFRPRTYIEITDSHGLVARRRPFTVECWARCRPEKLFTLVGDRVTGGQHPLVDPGTEVGWNLSLFRNDEQKPVVALLKGGMGFSDADNFRWFHLAFSSNGSEMLIFENGRMRTTRRDEWDPSVTNIFLGDGPHCRRPILATTDSLIDVAAFRISSVQRYQKDFLTPAAFASDSDTVVLLDFSRPSAERIPDLSGKGRDGMIVDAAWIDMKDNREVEPE